MNLTALHRRLLADVLAIGTPYPLVITGGYAVQAHGLADRGAVRDLIDVHAASRHHSTADLEMLGRRHARTEFSLHDLRDRLTGAEWWDDEDFTDYGLHPQHVAALRAWALSWANDLDTRLLAEDSAEED
ncbi:hypothetical protein AB0I84_36835 [Streptomyces spectabilis]|uniref:hypothetical protein n=1 Tax=Streptomyces spectabilis TaxID=68270 RepID=UPI0033EDAA2C